jgi:hypothetical protein
MWEKVKTSKSQNVDPASPSDTPGQERRNAETPKKMRIEI